MIEDFPSLNHLVIVGIATSWCERPGRKLPLECTVDIPRAGLTFQCGFLDLVDLAEVMDMWVLLSGKAKSNGYMQVRTLTCLGKDVGKYNPPSIHHLSALGRIGETEDKEHDLIIYREYISQGTEDLEAAIRCRYKQDHGYMTDQWATVQGTFYPDGYLDVRAAHNFAIKRGNQSGGYGRWNASQF